MSERTTTVPGSSEDPGQPLVDELPSYDASQAPPASQGEFAFRGSSSGSLSTTHKSALLDSTGKHEWLALRTTTKPRTRFSLPIFEEGDVIKGEVAVDSSRKSVAGVKSVTISIVGTATQLNHNPLKFLEQTQVLWTPTLTPFSATGQSGEGGERQEINYKWPFEFNLPERVNVDGAEYDLPPTLATRSSPVSIEYKLVVQVKRQGLFNPSKTLTTPFGYCLGTCAQAPSALRQASFREGEAVYGPTEDPEGWKILPSASVRGSVKGKTEPSEVEVTLAISQPTTYPLGSPVPLSLTLKSSDKDALDLLATPRALGPRACAVAFNSFAARWAGKGEHTANAPQGGPGGENITERRFKGELNVPSTAIPSFTFPRCHVSYTLDLHPLFAPGWTSLPTSSSEQPTPILSEPVTIVAKRAPGVPRARSAAPPGYKDESGTNVRVLGKAFVASGFL
ncbi:hypothetical protein NMY22_g10741 [Coprinellus aureogranulatus]|nr:hypothetical protein NMY22_g10741 [Coprinellus aureogranulatus]